MKIIISESEIQDFLYSYHQACDPDQPIECFLDDACDAIQGMLGIAVLIVEDNPRLATKAADVWAKQEEQIESIKKSLIGKVKAMRVEAKDSTDKNVIRLVGVNNSSNILQAATSIATIFVKYLHEVLVIFNGDLVEVAILPKTKTLIVDINIGSKNGIGEILGDKERKEREYNASPEVIERRRAYQEKTNKMLEEVIATAAREKTEKDKGTDNPWGKPK